MPRKQQEAERAEEKEKQAEGNNGSEEEENAEGEEDDEGAGSSSGGEPFREFYIGNGTKAVLCDLLPCTSYRFKVVVTTGPFKRETEPREIRWQNLINPARL